MNIKIIKYNAGNIQSVLFALERLGVEALVTDEVDDILHADKVIFPGVGEASTAMNYLKEKQLDRVIAGLKQPVLGVCLGMQLMCAHSEENDTPCLGIFPELVKKFQTGQESEDIIAQQQPGVGVARSQFKVPQIGWNSIYNLNTTLFDGLTGGSSYCYFVHSYYASLGEHTIASADYIHPYSAALHKDNFYGVQFHPEKSALVGERILKNFLNLK